MEAIHTLMFCILLCPETIIGTAEPCTGTLTEKEKEDILKLHNSIRHDIIGGAVKGQPQGSIGPLEWDPKLAEYARNAIKNAIQTTGDCPVLGTLLNSTLGQNVAAGPRDIEHLVKLWINEHHSYKFSDQFTPLAGDYTQMVWGKTKFVGCAIGNNCKIQSQWTAKIMLICLYYPRGNTGGYPYEVMKTPEDKTKVL